MLFLQDCEESDNEGNINNYKTLPHLSKGRYLGNFNLKFFIKTIFTHIYKRFYIQKRLHNFGKIDVD